MSLNGLDEARVAEAHQAALAEAGGWFLLKHATRDTVDLLARGTGGVVEARSAIEKYEEKSPLYGMVQFRRKKVILKYVPDGTSRLLQVRLTVQFQSVLDTLVPHDAVMSFTNPSELTEPALTSACMLHPTAGSLTSSSSSLRKQRLGEISEDVEESAHIRGQSKTKVVATPDLIVREDRGEPVSAPAPASPVTAFAPAVEKAPAIEKPLLPQKDRAITPPTVPKAPTERNIASPTPKQQPAPVPPVDKSLPTTPEPTPPNTSGGATSVTVTENQPELPPIKQYSDQYHLEESEARGSIQSTRSSAIGTVDKPTSYEPYSYEPYKPKVKRGPRPHVEPETRPQTAGSAKKPAAQKLVANLPNSVRAAHRVVLPSSNRPDSRQSSRSVPSRFVHYSEPPILPPLPSPNHISSLFAPPPDNRLYSRAGSITSTATATATPEKLRLMKALQMRKKNIQKAQRASTMGQGSNVPDSNSQSQDVYSGDDFRPSTSGGSSVGAETPSKVRTGNSDGGEKKNEAARMTSPTSMTEVSEVPSTQSSSFVEDNETLSRGSISSDTSSSVTPKADLRDKPDQKLSTKRAVGPQTATQPTSALENEPSEKQDPFVSGTGPSRLEPVPSESTVLNATNGSLTTGDSVTQNHQSGSADVHRPPNSQEAQDPDTRRAQPDGPQISSKPAMLDKEKRKPQPIKVISSPAISELSDDESFMEELQHAKMEQAKPVSVGRSPVTPIYRTLSGSMDRLRDFNRTVSSPLQDFTNSTSPSPGPVKSRSLKSSSTALPQWPPSNVDFPPVPLAKKGPLSSGISKRIKALEVFTARDSSISPPLTQPPNKLPQKSKATLGSSKKRLSFIASTTTPNSSINTAPPTHLPTLESTAEAETSRVAESNPWVQRQGSATEVYAPQQKGETISVTARIIRNPEATMADPGANPTEPQTIRLQRSLLTFEHDRPRERRPSFSRNTPQQSEDVPPQSSRSERGRPSFSSFRSDSQPRLPTSGSMTSRVSSASGRKKAGGYFARSTSDNSSIAEEKSKGSRTRRLLSRVSNLTGNSRRTLAGALSPIPKEQTAQETITERAESETSDVTSISHVVDIGDVNVQFPDTLLWKRRFLRIDDQGYLIFTPPAMESNTRGISRRFHLGEFKRPVLPDVEREEMAWSILLDLEDGTCIQCACESKYSQGQVLRMLVDAHSAYHQLFA